MRHPRVKRKTDNDVRAHREFQEMFGSWMHEMNVAKAIFGETGGSVGVIYSIEIEIEL